MKYLSLILFLLPAYTFAQMVVEEEVAPKEIGEIRIMNNWFATMEYWDSTEMYLLSFRNLEYQHIIDVKSFTILKSDFEQFFGILQENLQTKETKELKIKVPNGEIKLKFSKKKVAFWYWDGYNWSMSQYFNEKQIKRLFGKE